MLSLSIIVPATGRQDELDNTLVSVLENRPKNCEILVPHPDAYQDPYDLGDEVRFIPCSSSAVIDLYNAGISASRADIVHLLGSGSEVSAGWTDRPRETLQSHSDLAAVSPRLQQPGSAFAAIGIKYARGGSRRVITTRRTNSSSKAIDAPCLHAAFVRHGAFAVLGPLDASLDEYYAEVDLAARMRRQQLQCVHSSDSSVVGELTQRSTGFQAARQMERVFWRHAAASGLLPGVVLHLATIAGQLVPQIASPRWITSSLGHLKGSIECLANGSNPPTIEPSAPASEESSTIRLQIPADATPSEVCASRRGA